MGLDTVELVMEIEETFGITIADNDAAEIRTVGQLLDLILAHLPEGETACLSQATFYRLRRGLIAASGCPRQAVRPESDIAELLPVAGRREAWQ